MMMTINICWKWFMSLICWGSHFQSQKRVLKQGFGLIHEGQLLIHEAFNFLIHEVYKVKKVNIWRKIGNNKFKLECIDILSNCAFLEAEFHCYPQISIKWQTILPKLLPSRQVACELPEPIFSGNSRKLLFFFFFFKKNAFF